MENENETNDGGKDVLLSYIGMSAFYQQGKLMSVAGREDAAPGDVGTLDLPVEVPNTGINPSTDTDPVLFSYLYTKGGQSSLRQLLVKLNAPAQKPARFSVLVPSADGEWATQTVDITLIDNSGTVVSINPHGLAQYGNYLYLPDYESTKIVIVNAGDLEAAADGKAIEVKTFELRSYWRPVNNGRGQAAVILGQFLYVLGIDADGLAENFGPSVLFRLAIDSVTGALTYDTQAAVGINAQSIIPVNDGKKDWLLVPAIGGEQSLAGETNGTDSNISYVEAEAETWPGTAAIAVTGDPGASPATAYDIHAAAAAMRDGDSALFILTQIYTTDEVDADGAPWRLYRTTVGDFLNIGGITLSAAVTAGKLTVVDGGNIKAGNFMDYIAYGISMWDLLYEQVPDAGDDEGDRLWAALGSPILVTHPGYDDGEDKPLYGSHTSLFRNDFVMFGHLGGVNVNMGAFDLLIETQNQAKRGVSLKRSIHKAQAPRPSEEDIAAAQAKAAQAKSK